MRNGLVMAKLINLKTARKQIDRKIRRRKAEERAAQFGRSKFEKETQEFEQETISKRLDGHKRDK